MTKIIALANHKGGVGKTTSVVSIGAVLADRGHKVLLIDLDAQANLTTSLTGNKVQERTIYNALREGKDIPVVKLKDNLSIVPSTLELAGIELQIGGVTSREFLLKDLIEPIQDDYDYILLDCPPSLGLVTINAFVASTDLYIPLKAEFLPFNGLKMITDILQMVKKRLNPSLTLSGIIVTQWDNRKLNKMVEDEIKNNFGNIVFNTRIRTNIAIAEAPLSCKDIVSYNPQSNGAKDYSSLVDEILERK